MHIAILIEASVMARLQDGISHRNLLFIRSFFVSMLCLVMFFPHAGQGEDVEALDCRHYRLHEMFKYPFVVNAGDLPREYFLTSIFYDKTYKYGPYFPCHVPGCPVKWFRFDMRNGFSEQDNQGHDCSFNKSCPYANMRIQGFVESFKKNDKPLVEQMLENWGRYKSASLDPMPAFIVLGTTIPGFQQIEYVDQLDKSNVPPHIKPKEMHIRNDPSGKLESFITCNSPKDYPVPHCKYYTYKYPFILHAGFKRENLTHVHTMIEHAHSFTACLFEREADAKVLSPSLYEGSLYRIKK